MLYLLLLSLLDVSFAIEKYHVQNNYFAGRRPNVVVLGDLVKGDNNVLLVGGNVESIPEAVSVMDLGDALARSYWVGKLRQESVVQVGANLPSASLNLFLFGVDADDLARSPAKDALLSSMQQSELTVPFHPADATSIVTSAMTGRVPRDHGVVGATWFENGEEVQAFSTAGRSPATIGAVDMLKNSFPQLSMTAGGADQIVGKALTQGLYDASYLDETKFVSPEQSYSFTWEELQAKLSEDPFWVGLKTNVDALDLEHPVNKKFLMQMEYFNRVASNMQASDNLELFNLATTALDELYLVSDDAIAILSATVQNLLTTFSENFPNGSSQVAFIKTPEMEQTEAHTNLESKLSEFGKESATANVRGIELLHVCQPGVICVVPHNQPGVDVSDEKTQQIFQIKFWFSFLMALLITVFSCSFCGMDYSSDALLFTKWNRDA